MKKLITTIVVFAMLLTVGVSVSASQHVAIEIGPEPHGVTVYTN